MTMRLSRTLILSAIAMLVSMPGVFAQTAKTPEQQVLQADTDRFAAMMKGDLAALDRLLAVELTYIHSSARLEDKHAFLYGIRSGGTKYVNIVPTERQAHVMNAVAVITGVAAVHMIDRGEDLDITIRYTNVHVLRDGRWQMVSWQATQIVPNDKVIPGGPA